MLTFYNYAASPYSARCRIQIYAKDLPVKIETLAPPFPDWFLKLNPLKKLPALDIDGFILPESEVICEYLEDLGKGPSLRPDDPKERARMRLFSRLSDLYLMPCVGKLVPFLRGTPRDEAVITAAAADIDKGLRDLAHFGLGQRYAVGGKLSLADCSLMPGFMGLRGIFGALKLADPLAKVSAASAYYDATANDPHITRVLGEMSEALKAMMAQRH